MTIFKFLFMFFICFLGFEKIHASESLMKDAVHSELKSRYPESRIEILKTENDNQELDVKKIIAIREEGQGLLTVTYLNSKDEQKYKSYGFSAYKKVWVAKRKIKPTEKLISSDFEINEVDVSRGLAHQYRQLMISVDKSLQGLEARQSILEGQYPLLSSVQKLPEIRRGDVVTVKVSNQDVLLMTTAVAQEPGAKDEQIRIITQKSKKELSAKVKDTGLVEVSL